MNIHPSAIIDPSAHIHPSVLVGPFSIIEAGATLGPGCVIEGRVTIKEGTTLGPNNRVLGGGDPRRVFRSTSTCRPNLAAW